MMTIEQFLSYISHLNIKLWVDGDSGAAPDELRLRCKAPKGTLTPALRAELAERKAEILTFLSKANLAVHSKVLPILPVPRDEDLPLSFAQSRLWFLDQLDGENSAYKEFKALKISGSLQVDALEQSLKEIVRRHEILRTTFKLVKGSPVQVIASTVNLTLPVVDLQALKEAKQLAAVKDLVAKEVQQPVDLSNGPLLQVTLVRMGVESHVLFIIMHHIISDGWSVGVFVEELTALYQAFCAGKLSPLPELPIQYADFACWQRQWLQGQVLQSQLDYWKQQLAGIPPLLELPTDRPRPTVQTHRGSTKSFQINRELTTEWLSLSQKSGATLFMTLLAAFAILLSRYSSQSDIVVGSPIANRNRREIEPLIGFFVNTLVLRIDLEGNPSFSELLKRVHQVSVNAYAHQDLPFEQLVEALQPQRNLSYNPLFQVMFVLQNAPVENLELPGLKLTPLELENVGSNFDLTLSMEETEQGLVGTWEYNTDLFDATTMHRMSRHFPTILEGIVANPEQRLSQLPLLSAAEQHQLLVEWNHTQTEFPQQQCIHQLFEAQVERTPDAVALVFEDQQLSYRELNCRANQLAHYLQTIGVGPEVLVGLCVERSLEMVVGLLGIVKAGGAYVPLDPAYPPDRLEYMLQDSQIQVLLTQQKLVANLPVNCASMICLDTDWQQLSESDSFNPISGVQPENLTYVIYTSGSTGKPKGVMVAHQSVVNFAQTAAEKYQLTQGDRILQFASISFDTAAEEIYPCLICGGMLLLRSDEMLMSVATFVQKSVEWQLTVWDLPTAYWHHLTTELASANVVLPRTLRLVIIGGEKVNPEPVRTWQQLVGSSPTLVNTYGPTETTVIATVYNLSATASVVDGQQVPIGCPISNIQTFVLDRHQQPVAIGVTGELYITGAGVTRGYLNRPDLTSEKFIPNPFTQELGARLYKTGDLVRYLSDGNIEYLGRIDQQVKIRGFRIELGEIEAVLAQHPQVRSSVAIVREKQPGNKHLVAYVVSNSESDAIYSDLRNFLKQRLPDYMVPSAFVSLEQIPLNANGKVDYRALPAPDIQLSLTTSFVSPHTPTQELLTHLWAEVLGLEQVGIHNNFFELGGHSLLAAQVISRLRSVFGVDLPLRCLFESPTVAELSETVQAARHSGLRLVAPTIEPMPRNVDLPLSFAQTRLWFLNQLEGETATYNISGALQLIGSLQVDALSMAVEEILLRHEILRTTFPVVNGSPVQVIADATSVTIPVIDLQALPEEEQSTRVQRWATLEAVKPFDLSNDPLVRVTLLRLGEQSHVLQVTMHHIVSDGWSVGIFIRELSALYKAFCTEAPSPLPKLLIQYADFAHWQREWLSGEVLQTQLNYWKQQLAGAPPLLELPTDHPRPLIQTFQGSTEYFQLNQHLTQKLKTLSQQSGATLFMTLLAAFATLLFRYSAQEDIVIGSPIANRNRCEIEPLIGFFVNTLVLRTNLQGNPTFLELLTRVRQIALDAYAHQDLPFEELVEALQPQRNLSYNPLFQVMFVLQNAPVENLELPGLKLTPLELENVGSNFDLTLSMEETEQGLVGTWEYNTDLFDATTMHRMSRHFPTILEGIVANPEQRLSQLPLLSAAEQHQLLVEWNHTQTEFPQQQCIHQLFEAQVERTPDAVALVFENQQLSYRELNSRANQLAHYLQTIGVGPEVLVGLCVERSLEMVVGLLGIIKAGGAYVPLDPAYPPDRLEYMLQDSQIQVLLTQQKLVGNLPVNCACMICLDTDWQQLSESDSFNPISGVQPENLTYVIYTSGSTGKPKGVMVTHQSVVNFAQTAAEKYQLTQGDRILQFASISFDTAAEEIYPCLICGGMLLLRSDEMLMSVATFVQKSVEWQLTVWDLPTAYWHHLTTELASANVVLPRTLRLVIIGGEKANPEPVRTWQQLVGSSPGLVNTYGPTETTVIATVYNLSATASVVDGQQVPIGCPISNVQTFVLDRHQQPVPIGVPGELYITGAGVARGYLNRPDLTSEKFIPNPFTQELGARLYKTGDLVRYLSDGNIEYLGRIDQQVKIRGFRIELGEIEAVLSQYPGVQQTVVLVREDSPGNQRLVAYVVVTHQEVAPTTSNLRSFLQQKLPTHMVPTHFVLLDVLPLTPNGKVNHRALPIPDTAQPEWVGVYVQPQTELERMIATIWQNLLQVDKVGLHDNFFDLGGHSLLLIKVHSQLREIFNQDVSILEIFKYPTVSSFAKYLSQEKSDHLSSFDKGNNQLEDMKSGRNRLKQRLLRSSIVNQEK